jgi:hypothetical protein
MISKTYKDIVAKSIIMSREEGLSSSGQRRLLAQKMAGSADVVDAPVKIYMSENDCKVLSGHGFGGIFKAGDNFVTMSEIRLVVSKIRPKAEKLKNDAKREKLARVVNRLMSTFGPYFVKGAGGYIDVGRDVTIVPRNTVIKAKPSIKK